MERLGQRDYGTILDFLQELYAPAVLDEFPTAWLKISKS